MSSADIALLQKWIKGRDAHAFNEIVSRYADMVYSTCTRILGNPADAEEITQDCFLKLARGDVEIRSSLGGWLHTVATRGSLDRIRSDNRRKEKERQFAGTANTHAEVGWDDVQDYVDDAISSLPENLREPVIRHFLERETHETIASSLRISRPAVTQRIDKGITQIRKFLKRRGVPVSGSALAVMMAEIPAEAAPATLTSALGKLALAGSGGIAAVGTATTSKLALIGGVAFMWKSISLGLAAIVLVLGLVYLLSSPRDDETITFNTEQQTMAAVPDETSTVETVTITEPDETLSPAVMETQTSEQAEPETTTDDSDETGMAPQTEELKPYTSEDIPEDNGAHYFLLAHELFPDIDREWFGEKWTELLENGWTEDPELRELFEQCREALDAIRMGLEVGNCEMPEWRGANEMEYLSSFRGLARVMSMEGMMFEAEGDYGAAFDNYLTAMEFGNESSRGLPLIGGYVGFAIKGIGLNAIGNAVESGGATPDDYRFLIETMESLENTRLSMGEIMNVESKVHDVMVESDPSYGRMISMFPETEKDYLEIVSYMKLPYYELKQIDTDAIVRRNPFNEILFPAFSRAKEAATKDEADLRGTTIMAGVELFRRENNTYPYSLEDLVPNYLSYIPEDPFTGNSFLYGSSGSSYVLYSTGSDMQDDGGWGNDWRNDGSDLVFHGN